MFTLDKLKIVGIIQHKKYVNDMPYKILIISYQVRNSRLVFTQYIIPHKTHHNTVYLPQRYIMYRLANISRHYPT